MSTRFSSFDRVQGRPRFGGLRAAALLAAGVFALTLGQGSRPGQAQTPGSSTPAIPTKGTVRVAALRIEFVPDPPPVIQPTPANPNPTQVPQLPATRFARAEDDAYFRNVLAKVHDYFREVSYGKLDLNFTLGPVVAEHDDTKDMLYYANPNAITARSQELMQTAMTLSEGAGFNFGQTDLVLVFHAGAGKESDFANAATNLILSTGMQTALTSAGKSFTTGVLQSASEVQPFTGEDLSIIGRTCLGVATALGAVRTGGGLGQAGDPTYTGVWDLMDSGWMLGPLLRNANRTDWSTPAHMNPAEKIRMGWLTPVALTKNVPSASIPQAETNDTNSVYRMWSAGVTGQEYFLVENRQTVGYDAYLPSSGLLIWHIDESQLGQVNSARLRVQLLQADGLQEIEQQMSAGNAGDPFPGQLSVRSIDGSSTPGLRDATNTATLCSISEISNSSQVMTANLYITAPMILSYKPKGGFTTESVTPTFKASFSTGIDPSTIKLTVDGTAVISSTNYTRYYDAASRQLTYKSAQLSFGQHTYSIDVQDLTRTISESTGNLALRINFRTVSAGLRMVSVPYILQATDNNPGTVFGAGSVSLARWNAVQGSYAYYPASTGASLAPPPDDPSQPSKSVGGAPAGLAYWIRLTTSSPVHITGDQLEDQAYAIPAFPGWNMIGDPFTFPVDWSGVQVEYLGQRKTLEDAVDADWISPTLYTYQSSGYVWQTAPNGQLQPWEGYWVKVLTPGSLTLYVPPVESGIGSLRSAKIADPGRASVPGQGWRMRLSAVTQSGVADTYNFLGVSSASKDGSDRYDVEKPPAPGQGTVSVSLVEGGRSLAQDLHDGQMAADESWLVNVDTDLKQERVTLSWANMSEVPSNLEVRVEDLATGKQIYCRTRGAYSFNSGDGGTRQFRFTVAPRRTAPLSVSGVSVQQTRGASSVRFTLNRPALVRVALLSPANMRVVRELVSEHAGTMGVNTIFAGRSDSVAAGIYFVQVTATAEDGASTVAVQPYVVTR